VEAAGDNYEKKLSPRFFLRAGRNHYRASADLGDYPPAGSAAQRLELALPCRCCSTQRTSKVDKVSAFLLKLHSLLL
jgi:hypothetical protein